MTELDSIKQHILNRSIEEDQSAVATQWLSTLLFNDPNSTAIQITKLLISSIARGSFQTQSVGDSKLTSPNDVLTVADYISHASRVIIDYKDLSPEYCEEFLAFFPNAQTQDVVARSSTHAVTRNAQGVKELKGLHLGLRGQLPAIMNQVKDFGVDIAMGGEGKTNFVMQTIAKNGYSGHLLFHRNDKESLMMIGLEQSAPAHSILSYLDLFSYFDQTNADIQNHTDQFGQGHSIVGGSDTYTAAGSLYFSDPLYQAKLLVEKNALPPQKYGGMQVVINNDNWQDIKYFFEELSKHATTQNQEMLFQQLVSKPITAVSQLDNDLPYIALDFRVYLHQSLNVFVPQGNHTLSEQQNRLATHIEKMQKCIIYTDYLELHDELKTQINLLISTATQNLTDAEGYIRTILRIQILFENQLRTSRILTASQQALLQEEQIDQAEKAIEHLLMHLNILQNYFQEHPSRSFKEADQITLTHLIQLLIHFKSCAVGIEESIQETGAFEYIETAEEKLIRYQPLITEAQDLLARLTLSKEQTENIDTNEHAINDVIEPEHNEQLIDASESQRIKDELHTTKAQLLQQTTHLSVATEEILSYRNAYDRALTAKEHIDSQLLRLQRQLRVLDIENTHLKAQQNALQNHASHQPPPAPLFDGFTFQIIGAFSMLLGVAAVALAITALILGTGGIAALAAGAAIGLMSCFTGGLFYHQGSQQKRYVLSIEEASNITPTPI